MRPAKFGGCGVLIKGNRNLRSGRDVLDGFDFEGIARSLDDEDDTRE